MSVPHPIPVPHNEALNGRLKHPKAVQTRPVAKLNYHMESNFHAMSLGCKHVTGHRLNVRRWGSYRSRALQRLMRAFPWRYKVIKINGKYVAQKPVGFSTHGWGDAIDVEDDSLAFMLRFGPAYGWHRTIDGDTYHFQYTGHLNGNVPPQPK